MIRLLLALSFAPIYTPVHDAPKGWTYPNNCCSGIDCREVPASALREVKTGWVIKSTDELILFTDPKLKESPDGAYHWCSQMGQDNTKTICLFVPPMSY